MHIPDDISLNKEGQFCIECFSKNVERVLEAGLTYYYCRSCGKTLERSLVIDNHVVWWVDKVTKKYWHEGVGIFVFNFENKALFFERIIYPFALTIPAGHLDAAEDTQIAVRRELFEETGIEIGVDSIKFFSEEDVVGDKCRRGADDHKWHLYTTRIKNIATPKINDEGVKPVWLSLEDALRKKLTYPVRYFIEKYGNKLFG
jgi:8-oxo-dGTP pyrophosphatase MutT (NUDIX family)